MHHRSSYSILYSTSSASSSSTQSRIHCTRMQTTQYYTDGSRVHTYTHTNTHTNQKKEQENETTHIYINKQIARALHMHTNKQTFTHSSGWWLSACDACARPLRVHTPRTELCTFRSILAWHKLCACARLRALAGWPGWPPCWLAIFCRHCVCTALQHHSLDSHLTYTHTHMRATCDMDI